MTSFQLGSGGQTCPVCCRPYIFSWLLGSVSEMNANGSLVSTAMVGDTQDQHTIHHLLDISILTGNLACRLTRAWISSVYWVSILRKNYTPRNKGLCCRRKNTMADPQRAQIKLSIFHLAEHICMSMVCVHACACVCVHVRVCM